MHVLGIDIGGTGIKGAPVDTATGKLLSDRHRILTPHPATPDAVASVCAEIVKHFGWKGPIGAGLPAVVQHGVVRTAANIDQGWIGVDATKLLAEKTGCSVGLVNDADAAGLAEARFGAGKGKTGTVLLLTLGTGIGSALFVDGKLVPNTELGHLHLKKKELEHRAADSVRTREDLSWSEWGKRLNKVLVYLDRIFWPDLIILGGGASKKLDKFSSAFTLKTEVVAAQLLNEAGIVGAALAGPGAE
jgi:polyphosphate glucokinase